MPVRRVTSIHELRVPNAHTTSLTERLAAEWRQPSEAAEPLIVELREPDSGVVHLYVVWGEFEGTEPQRRSEIVMAAYAKVAPFDLQNVALALGLLHNDEALRMGVDVTRVQENPYIVQHRREKAMMAALGVDIDSPSFKLKSLVSEGAFFLRSWRYGAQTQEYVAALTKTGEAVMQAAGELYDGGQTFWFRANVEQCALERAVGDVPDTTHPTGVVFVGVKKDADWFAQLAFVALHAEAGVNNDQSADTLRFRDWLRAQKIDRAKYPEQWVFNLVRNWRLSRTAYAP